MVRLQPNKTEKQNKTEKDNFLHKILLKYCLTVTMIHPSKKNKS